MFREMNLEMIGLHAERASLEDVFVDRIAPPHPTHLPPDEASPAALTGEAAP